MRIFTSRRNWFGVNTVSKTYKTIQRIALVTSKTGVQCYKFDSSILYNAIKLYFWLFKVTLKIGHNTPLRVTFG